VVRERLCLPALLLIASVGCASLDLEALLRRDSSDARAELRLDRPVDLLPPDGLRVTSTEDRAVSMAWNPVLVGDVAGYAVLRATEAAGPFELVGQTESRFGTIFEDAGEAEQRLGDGKTYHYRIHPRDPEGRISRSHAYVSATTDPSPTPTDGLRAYSNLPRRVVLAWDPNDDRSVTAYAILRSPTAAGPWEHIGQVAGRLNTVYEDPVPGDLRVMYYQLVAMNRFGGESDPTPYIRAVTKAEPLPPIGLTVAARRLGAIDLEWDPNVEPDLAAYLVYRSVEKPNGFAAEELIGAVLPDTTRWSDDEVGCNQLIRYRLRALDIDGLESGFSIPLDAVGEHLGLELRPPSEAGPELHWDSKRAQAWPYVRISEIRRVLPDRVLGILASSNSFPLSGLGPGSHRLGVVLTHRGLSTPRDLEAPADSPICILDVQLP
jgi:fibronectin type 3 domain-containing protein